MAEAELPTTTNKKRNLTKCNFSRWFCHVIRFVVKRQNRAVISVTLVGFCTFLSNSTPIIDSALPH